jgi:hypothetical protein
MLTIPHGNKPLTARDRYELPEKNYCKSYNNIDQAAPLLSDEPAPAYKEL